MTDGPTSLSLTAAKKDGTMSNESDQLSVRLPGVHASSVAALVLPRYTPVFRRVHERFVTSELLGSIEEHKLLIWLPPEDSNLHMLIQRQAVNDSQVFRCFLLICL